MYEKVSPRSRVNTRNRELKTDQLKGIAKRELGARDMQVLDIRNEAEKQTQIGVLIYS